MSAFVLQVGQGSVGLAELDPSADRAKIELDIGQVLALLHGLQRQGVQPGVDFLDFQCITEHALGLVAIGIRLRRPWAGTSA